jgi:hypothetical protein
MERLSKIVIAVAAFGGLISTLAVHAEETSYENMVGRAGGHSPTAAFSPVLAYGENSQVRFPPRISRRSDSAETAYGAQSGGGSAYCVRTCDGRYFPAPSSEDASRAESCKSLCPASETKVFYGSSIDGASSTGGKPYSALANAFRYRKELVAGCTCNGKDVIGLASIKVAQDKTLRGGDVVATADGLQVVRSTTGGEPRFSAVAKTDRVTFVRPPVLASQ